MVGIFVAQGDHCAPDQIGNGVAGGTSVQALHLCALDQSDVHQALPHRPGCTQLGNFGLYPLMKPV